MANVMLVDPDEIGLDTTPNSLPAWDSLRHLNLVLALEEAYGFTLAPEDTERMIVVSAIVDTVHRKLNG
jgi:acyl carrier protein